MRESSRSFITSKFGATAGGKSNITEISPGLAATSLSTAAATRSAPRPSTSSRARMAMRPRSFGSAARFDSARAILAGSRSRFYQARCQPLNRTGDCALIFRGLKERQPNAKTASSQQVTPAAVTAISASAMRAGRSGGSTTQSAPISASFRHESVPEGSWPGRSQGASARRLVRYGAMPQGHGRRNFSDRLPRA